MISAFSCLLGQAASADAICAPYEPAAGDLDYGAHLAGECVTCHQSGGEGRGIPSIAGLTASDIISALQAYRCGQRQHRVMEMIAGQLGDAEIAALAAYFATLGRD